MIRIRRFLLIVLLAFLPAVALADKISDAEKRLADSAAYLASDKLEGRGLTTDGINVAADYIAEQFKQIGLKTDVFEGSPFQEFDLVTSAKLGKENVAALVGPDGKEIKLKLGGEYTPMGLGGSGKLGLPIVFVGYGITAKDLGYDDFAGIDVKGKAVILLRKEPQQGDPHSKFNGTETTPHSFFTRKVSNAYQNGAAAVILINDEYDIRATIARIEKSVKSTEDQLAKLKKEIGDNEPTENQAKQLKGLEQSLVRGQRRLKTLPTDPLMQFGSGGTDNAGRNFPVITMRRAVLDQALKAALGKDLSALEKEIDKDLKPRSAELKGWRVAGQVSVDRTKTKVKNVVGVMEGFGPLAEETIVIGAHYDHLGRGEPGSLARGSKEIHNGADDNASGTATLIEIARRIAELRKVARFRALRRIVFIAFTAEERGLLGSQHYVEHPAFDLSKTVAMLNLDMVGRMRDEKLIIQGVDTAKEFGAILDRLNENDDYSFKITRRKGGHGPSDHQSFYVKSVPVMHLYTDTHKDYHRPSDDSDKLNVPGMRRIGGLVSDIALAVATAEKRPTYVRVAAPKMARRGPFPSFGSIPDYGFQGNGYRLNDVRDDGPAKKAGLQGGDVMVQLDKYKIGNVTDFMNALINFKPGDKVKVTVLRGKEKVMAEVTLGEPR